MQLLGSTGGEGHRKQVRALAKKAEKMARTTAAAAREARFFQAEPLSPEFEFVVRLRDRCAAGALQALHLERERALSRRRVEARQKSDRLITVRQLRLMGSSGLLLTVLRQLSCHRTNMSKSSAEICSKILARVSARTVTTEVSSVHVSRNLLFDACLVDCS